jgi:hypothetical protein
MDILPLWAQIIIGIFSAGFVSSIITIVGLVLTLRQKNKELQDAKLQRLNDNLLQNTRPHIDTLYIPISKILSKLESQYDVYKSAKANCLGYEVKKRLEIAEGQPEEPARIELGHLLYGKKHDAIFALVEVFQEMRNYQEKMIIEGTIAYLTKEFEERLDFFVRFLYGANIVIHTYILAFQAVPNEQPKVFILGTSEFDKELYSEINYFRSYIRELALGTNDTIKSPSKKTS